MSAERKKGKKSKRRRFIELAIKGGIGWLAYDIANHGCYSSARLDKPDEKVAYERTHALPYETLHAHSTGYKFGYPKEVPEGWGFVHYEGGDTLTTMLHEELAVMRNQTELQFSLQGGALNVLFPGIFVTSYQDSTGRLVPRISYKSGIMDSSEYVLIGHLSERPGSFSNQRPDIIRIFNEYYPADPTYYASLTVTQSRRFLRTYRTINVS